MLVCATIYPPTQISQNCLSNLHTVLENRPYHAISEQAVQKLVDTLDDLQKMIEKHNKTSMKSKTKRFILGDSNVAKIQRMYWAFFAYCVIYSC